VSNLLRVVGDDGVDRKALPSLVRLSKRQCGQRWTHWCGTSGRGRRWRPYD